ncbi:MAG: TonB-dependent receptor domain-containing protein, partial [Terriglobia bacterium]
LVAGQRLGEISVGDLTAFNPRTSEPVQFHQQIYTWSDDLFVTKGAHALKFGALINKFQQFVSLLNDAIGLIEFDDTLSFLRGEPTSFRSATPGSEFARDMRFTTLGFYVQDDWKVRQNLTLNMGLRYEFSTQPNEVSGHNGALRNITDPAGTLGIPFENNSKKNFSPRIGFAWDVLGDATTAVRGGFGFLYDLGNMGTAFRYGTLNPPFGSLSSLEAGNFVQPFTTPIVYPPGSAGRSQEIVDFHLKQPRIYQWNLTVERQLPWNTALSVGYVGTRGVRLLGPREGNPRVPTIVDGQRFWAANAPRVSPHWDDVIMMTAGAGSWYNGLQVGFSKRLGSGLQFQTSYTWAVAMDDVQGQFQSEFNSTSGDMGADPGNMRYDWNPAAFDYRHNLVSNAIYRLPNFISSGGVGGALLNGWWVSGIVTTNTGFPLTPVINSQWSRSGIRGAEVRIDRPNLKPDRDYDSIVLGGPVRYFDPTAFELQPQGFKGNSQRGGIRGPGFATLDFSLVKDTAVGFLGESGRMEFRAEFFNLFNRVNFGVPERRVFAGRLRSGLPDQTILATAGRINSTLIGGSPSRQVQLALKLVF